MRSRILSKTLSNESSISFVSKKDTRNVKGESMEVVINNIKWDVQFVSADLLPADYLGYCCSENLTIRVLDTLSKTRRRYTLIHELVHALLQSQGRTYQWEDMNEEDVCELIAWNLDTIYKLVQQIELMANNSSDSIDTLI